MDNEQCIPVNRCCAVMNRYVIKNLNTDPLIVDEKH